MFVPVPYHYIEEGVAVRYLVVDHIDDVKYHNIYTNLQWLTGAENTRKYYRTVIDKNDLIIDMVTVQKICEDLTKGTTIYEISEKYNVSEMLVYNIRYGIRYKGISKKYTFPSAQLSEDDVVKICEALQSGMSSKKVSDEYGYSLASVTHILCGNTWTQISKDYTFPRSRVKDDVIHAICKRLEEGASAKEVATEFEVGVKLVKYIKWGKTHTDISSQYNIPKEKFKVSDDVIHAVCKDLASGEYNMNEIAERNGISRSFVKAIKYRKHRTDISDNYEW
jgi:transposase